MESRLEAGSIEGLLSLIGVCLGMAFFGGSALVFDGKGLDSDRVAGVGGAFASGVIGGFNPTGDPENEGRLESSSLGGRVSSTGLPGLRGLAAVAGARWMEV